MIHTERLTLVPATVETASADLQAPADLARLLNAAVPESWPPALYDAAAMTFTLRQLHRHPEQAEWWLYYFVRQAPEEPTVLIGAGGYKGAPDTEGTVEVGYAVLPEYRRRGYATEATRGLIDYAFSHAEVQQVVAETLPELYPSIGVLKKCNFALVGAGSTEGAIRYALTRSVYEQLSGQNAGKSK